MKTSRAMLDQDAVYPISLSAIFNISSFVRMAKTKFKGAISPEETALAEYVLQSVIASEVNNLGQDALLILSRCANLAPIFARLGIQGVHLLPYSMQSSIFQKITNANYETWIFTRKLLIREKIEKNSGHLKQVVFLGAGFDPVALYLASRYPGIKFYEVDRGETFATKIKMLSTMPPRVGITVNCIEKEDSHVINDNLVCIDCDLQQKSIAEALIANDFDPNAQTLVIAEGLTMYLDEVNIRKLFADLKKILLSDRSELLISFESPGKQAATESVTLDAAKESYRFCINPVDVVNFVAESGFEVTGKTNRLDGAYSAINPPLDREFYFQLRVGDKLINQSILDVPDIDPDVTRLTSGADTSSKCPLI